MPEKGELPRCRVCGCPLLVWLRPKQVAQALQVGRRHVLRLTEVGELQHTYLGKVVRVHHGSLHNYIDEKPPQPDCWKWPGAEITSRGRGGKGGKRRNITVV